MTKDQIEHRCLTCLYSWRPNVHCHLTCHAPVAKKETCCLQNEHRWWKSERKQIAHDQAIHHASELMKLTELPPLIKLANMMGMSYDLNDYTDDDYPDAEQELGAKIVDALVELTE